MSKKILPKLSYALLMLICASSSSLPAHAEITGLTYDINNRGPAPIPPSEKGLQTVTAETWLGLQGKGIMLEGAIFDAKGNLLFCDVTNRKIMRLSPSRKLSTVVTLNDLRPGGIALDKDGKLLIAAIDMQTKRGAIFSSDLVTHRLHTIIAPELGYIPNDIAVDAQGGFYFSDFRGTSTAAQGGVYYVSPSTHSIKTVLSGLSQANGIALSHDGKTLWVTEFGRNLLHRIILQGATQIDPIGSSIPYHFIGAAPDSMRMDKDGNVYVAMYGQGRVLVFNPNGIPIGQILLPERQSGKNLYSTSLALNPHKNEIFIVSSDGPEGRAASILRTKSFSAGL